jgi:hypothetical protein
MSKYVAFITVSVSFALGMCRPAEAGKPGPLCCEFWREAWEDPFGCKAACKAAAPAAEPACAPKVEPVAPPTAPEAPPAPETAHRTAARQQSYSYDPAPATQAGAARSYRRPAARPVSFYRADGKLRGP